LFYKPFSERQIDESKGNHLKFSKDGEAGRQQRAVSDGVVAI